MPISLKAIFTAASCTVLLSSGMLHAQTALERLQAAQQNQAAGKFGCPEEAIAREFLKPRLMDFEFQLRQSIYYLLKAQAIVEAGDCSCPTRFPDPATLMPMIEEIAAQPIFEDGVEITRLRQKAAYYDDLEGSYVMQIVAICK